MKHIRVMLALMLVCLLALTACGSDNKQPAATTAPTEAPTEAPTQAPGEGE